MMKSSIVFAYHDIGCVGIEALIEAGYEIKAVFTHVDDPHENRFFASVAQLCARHGIPVHAPQDAGHPLWVERIRALRPDFIFSFYYRNVLPADVLGCARLGAYNLHGSLLPRYRGRAPVNWVLVNGEQKTGVTLHRMVERPDAGPIAAQQSVPIEPQDTALTLHAKLREAARALLAESLPALARGELKEWPQDESRASTFGRRTAADGEIDWSRPAVALANLVRAVTQPYPGAFAWHGEHKLIVWSAAAVDLSHGRAPGTVLSAQPLRVACGTGALEITSGQQGDEGLYLSGPQLAQAMGLGEGLRLYRGTGAGARKTHVLILGVNGFIGNHLSERLLQEGQYEVYGLDVASDAVERFKSHPHFHYVEGDISIHRSGSNTTSRSAMSCCRWWPSRRPSSTRAIRCACSSWISRRT